MADWAGLAFCAMLCGGYFLSVFETRYVTRLHRLQQITTALKSAQSVRVEEFHHGQVLVRRELNATQRAVLLGIVPAILPKGAQCSTLSCFIPHHRIIARQPDGTEFPITLCFGCSQAQHADSPIYDMPPNGSAEMRTFMEQNGVRVLSLEGYWDLPPPHVQNEMGSRP